MFANLPIATATPTSTNTLVPTATIASTLTPTATPPSNGNLVVTTLSDSGPGSLRDALAFANQLGQSGDTITFQTGLFGTISLSSTLSVQNSTTIQGPGASVITLDGSGSGILFSVGAPLTISDLTLRNDTQGISSSAMLTVSRCVFSNGNDGIVVNAALAIITDSTFSNNNFAGVAVDGGTVTLSRDVFTGNSRWIR